MDIITSYLWILWALNWVNEIRLFTNSKYISHLWLVYFFGLIFSIIHFALYTFYIKKLSRDYEYYDTLIGFPPLLWLDKYKKMDKFGSIEKEYNKININRISIYAKITIIAFVFFCSFPSLINLKIFSWALISLKSLF